MVKNYFFAIGLILFPQINPMEPHISSEKQTDCVKTPSNNEAVKNLLQDLEAYKRTKTKSLCAPRNHAFHLAVHEGDIYFLKKYVPLAKRLRQIDIINQINDEHRSPLSQILHINHWEYTEEKIIEVMDIFIANGAEYSPFYLLYGLFSLGYRKDSFCFILSKMTCEQIRTAFFQPNNQHSFNVLLQQNHKNCPTCKLDIYKRIVERD